jgi:membrane-bound lytic murein transglycosylase C
MRKLGLLLFLLLFSSDYAIAQVSDFQAYQDSIRRAMQQFSTENDRDAAVAASLAEYEAYREQVLAEFEDFKSEMQEKWGDFKERSKTEWVEYIDGGNTRVEVDFEEDEVIVEVLVEDPEDVEAAIQDLPEKVVETINNQGTEMGFESEEAGDEPVLDEPVLEDQVEREPGESDEEVAERIVEENQVEVQQVVGEDGVERTLLSINFSLAPSSIQTRAEKVQDYVYNFSEEYEIAPPLVFAIIHTESYFNPMAQSPANAYGLMQLVPASGGADAYRSVHDEDGFPTPDFLFVPENNVELGCAYVDILLNRYLRDVSNDLSKQYLAISAYNTGTGNVYKAYDSGGSKSRAMAQIEAMTPQENYEHLIVNLPYEETRDYLKKVVDRSKLYESWSEN